MKKAFLASFLVLLGLGFVTANVQVSAADRDPGPMVEAWDTPEPQVIANDK